LTEEELLEIVRGAEYARAAARWGVAGRGARCRRHGNEVPMNGLDVLMFLGILAAWVLLQSFVLPRLGVPTW